MEGTGLRAMLARVVAACATAGAVVARAPASTEGSPGPGAGVVQRAVAAWREQDALRPPHDASWQLGAAVALHQGMLAVGPSHDWDLGVDHGGVRLYASIGDRFIDAGAIDHPSADVHAFFGAALALHGDTLAVGAPHDSNGGFQAGAVFVYQRGEAGWLLLQTLQRAHAVPDDLAGSAVAMDAHTLVIGVPKADATTLDAGAVEVYERIDGAWSHAATLTAPQARIGALFGLAVAVDGDTIFVGAPGDDALGPMAGRVHVFRRSSTGWRWQAAVGCPTGPRGWFGASVAAAHGRVVVGAPRAARSLGAGMSVRGAAWLLERIDGGWRCGTMLTPAFAEQGDSLGCAAATDGSTVVLGATADSMRGRLVGCAYVFSADAQGTWTSQRLDPATADPQSLVGHGVAVDERWVALGRLGDPESDPAAGEVTMFMRAITPARNAATATDAPPRAAPR
jgi:FG-GAP repeat